MTNEKRVRILIADDHPLVLEGVRACLDNVDHVEVVATARTGREALRLASECSPDIVLLDINMPEFNGLDAIKVFKEQLPAIRILILSMHDNREYISTALTYGARGYVLKDVPVKEIVAAIDAIHSGGTFFSSGISTAILTHDNSEHPSGPLTAREQTILLLLAEGDSNKEVARKLHISFRTVETHRKNIKKKLGITTTAGLTRYAMENGMIGASGNPSRSDDA